jgi:mono/diheme cytochrome c family protein
VNRYFSALILCLASFVPLACGKVYNSSSYDASTYGAADGTAQFLAAKDIIKTNCASCHTRPSHQAWAGFSEKDFISQNLIKAGNLAGSLLYTKIQGNRTATPGNMPDGGTLLTTAQIITIENWILNIPP